MPVTCNAGSFWNTVITKVPRLPLPITPRLIWSEGAAWTASRLPPVSRNVLLFMTLPPSCVVPLSAGSLYSYCTGSPRRRRPVQVLPEKLERALAIDGVRPVEEFDGGGLRHLHLHIVKPTRFRILVGHPFVRRYAVAVPPFHHEGSWRHEVREVGVIHHVGEIELDHVVLASQQVTVTRLDAGVLPDPFVKVPRTDRKGITIEQRRNPNRGLAAIRQAIKSNPVGIDELQAGQPVECSLMLP